MKKWTVILTVCSLINTVGLIVSCSQSGDSVGDTVVALPDTSKSDPANPPQDSVPPSAPVEQSPVTTTTLQSIPTTTTLKPSPATTTTTTTTLKVSPTTTTLKVSPAPFPVPPSSTTTTTTSSTTTTAKPVVTTTTLPAVSRSYTIDVLLFNGEGISISDWQNTEKILQSMGLTYRLVNTAAMNSMSLDQIANFGLILVPGGHRGGIMTGLTSTAQLFIRQAVRDRGVSYLGICAGAFAAVGDLANTNTTSELNLAVIYGKHLSNWWPNGDTSMVADIVSVKFADGSSRSLVWWGGPWTPEWKNGVVARYSDGKPAISQSFFAKGFVVLTGPHPEAPQGWRITAGTDPDGLDYDIAKKLIRAALEREPLPTF